MNPHSSRAHLPVWLVALMLGALVGMVVLGVGGHLAMRGITPWENRARQFTLDGTLRVMGFGALFGAAAAGLRVGIDALSRRFWPHSSEKRRTCAFAIASLASGLVLLTPLTIHRLVLFPPVVALYVLVFEALWRRTYVRTKG